MASSTRDAATRIGEESSRVSCGGRRGFGRKESPGRRKSSAIATPSCIHKAPCGSSSYQTTRCHAYGILARPSKRYSIRTHWRPHDVHDFSLGTPPTPGSRKSSQVYATEGNRRSNEGSPATHSRRTNHSTDDSGTAALVGKRLQPGSTSSSNPRGYVFTRFPNDAATT